MGIEMLIGVIVGGLLFTTFYSLFQNTIIPSVVEQISTLFSFTT